MRRAVLVLVLIASTSIAYAQDEFEIQVYDADTAKLGDPGLEVHVNEHLYPQVSDAAHVTFEPHYGLRAWLELGGYFQTAMNTSGDFAYAGVKLRAKLRWPRRVWCRRIGLAINFELSDVPAQFEPNVRGTEVRPIADLRVDRWYASVNPIVDTDLRGAYAGRPQFQPSAKLGFALDDAVMLGAEAYGAYGPFDALGSEDVERVYAAVDLRGRWWDLNIGVGVNRGVADHPIAKMIFGIHPSS
jgi:hypothetical protein